MKNKKAKQIAAKQKHKKQLKVQRRTEPNLKRQPPTLNEKPTILIVCEGENTEPSYFNQFRLSSATVKSVGVGKNPKLLVEQAKRLSSRQEKYDQVWCVFDKDGFKDNDFNNAIKKAEKQKFGVAYSNQAFEYWLILHFDDHQGGGMPRSDYNSKINKLLKPFGVAYDGNSSKVIKEDFFDLLDKRIHFAISRAERNYKKFDHRNPAKAESSTTVFNLAKELLKHTEN